MSAHLVKQYGAQAHTSGCAPELERARRGRTSATTTAHCSAVPAHALGITKQKAPATDGQRSHKQGKSGHVRSCVVAEAPMHCMCCVKPVHHSPMLQQRMLAAARSKAAPCPPAHLQPSLTKSKAQYSSTHQGRVPAGSLTHAAAGRAEHCFPSDNGRAHRSQAHTSQQVKVSSLRQQEGVKCEPQGHTHMYTDACTQMGLSQQERGNDGAPLRSKGCGHHKNTAFC